MGGDGGLHRSGVHPDSSFYDGDTRTWVIVVGSLRFHRDSSYHYGDTRTWVEDGGLTIVSSS